MSNIENMQIPTLGAGTFRLKGQDAYQSVEMALKLGYRHIDTAQIYGNEAEVGQAIADSGIDRSEVFITTKIWMDKLGKADFLPSLKESLEKLKTDYVDLLLIHWPLKDESVAMEEYLAELKQAKTLGLTRQIGISNFTNAQTAQAISILGEGEIFTNQVEVHPYIQNRTVTEFCQQHDILVTAYMPFAYGEVFQDEVLKPIAQKHDVTVAQVVLAWVIQQGFITIPSSTKEKNLAGNLEFSKVTLTEDDMQQIATLDRNHRLANPDFAPEWD